MGPFIVVLVKDTGFHVLNCAFPHALLFILALICDAVTSCFDRDYFLFLFS